MTNKIEISHKTIIFTVLFLIGLWVLYQIREIIVALFVAVILVSALNPAVDRLERFRFPRWLAILVLYFAVLGGLAAMLTILITPLVEQTAIFINRLGLYLQELSNLGIDPNLVTSQISQFGSLPANVLKTIVDVFSNLVGVFFVIVITFYLLLERKNLDHYLLFLLGEGEETKAEKFVNEVERRIGGWVRGELILMTVVGVMVYIGLRILGVESALPLALLAGILEIVPNIGPVLSAIPGVLIGLLISPITGVAVAALYFLTQQLENSLIAPKIMQKATGVNPLVTILALALGFKIAGVAGAILAVPVILVIQVVASELFSSKRFENL